MTPDRALSLIILTAIMLLGYAAIAPSRRLAAHRVRYTRLRMRLRLKPGHGHASLFELWLRWGRFATFRRSSRARPSLSRIERLTQPAAHSIQLGRGQYRHSLRVPIEEHVLIMAPPRTGKSGMLAAVILHYPGPVISTTTKADVYQLTSGVRAHMGPVAVFNPQGIGGVPSTFRWNPLEGCKDQAVAIRRADSFAKSVSMGSVEDASFWTNKASDYMRAFFHAAALADADMRVVTRWVLGGEPDVPVDILRAAGAHQWALTVAELSGEAQKTAQTVRMTMSRALAFMTDPALATSVLPGSGTGFDIATFLRQRGTLYMIAEADHDDSPVAPLFVCMANEVHHIAALQGQSMPGGRLDPPLLMALDEIVQTCPVPLPTWLADSGGKGIQIIPVAHGEAQLSNRWKDTGCRAILDTCGVKVLLPGISDTRTLEMASRLCGQMAFMERGQDWHSRHDVMTPDMIRQLPAGFALLLRGSLAPVVTKLPAAWKDATYKSALRRGLAVAPVTAVSDYVVPDLTEELVGFIRQPDMDFEPGDIGPESDAGAFPLELVMTSLEPEGVAHALVELARQAERLASVDSRETEHFRQLSERLSEWADAVAAVKGAIDDQQVNLLALEALRAEIDGLTAKLAEILPDDDGEAKVYRPESAPRWWKLDDEARNEALARLRSWVEHIFRPMYGHLATLGTCWESHPFCLMTLDWLSELWSVLYLQNRRNARVLSSQAEFQIRVLPAAAEQLAMETARCEHAQPRANGQRLSVNR